jgi:hypothetical protein
MVTKNHFGHVYHASRLLALGVVGAVAALAVGLAACGSGNGRDPLESTSANQAAQEAIANLKSASTVTTDGSVNESGTTYTFDLQSKTGTGCMGTIGEAGKGSLALVVIGKTVWFKPDDTMWKSFLGSSQASQAIALLNGRYIESSAKDASSLASLIALCDPDTLVSGVNKSTNFTKGTITTVNGQKVLPLMVKAHGGTLDVTDESAPEIVELYGSGGGNTGKIVFTEGTPVTVTAPPASQTLSGSQFGL